jgi:hypothetical protein
MERQQALVEALFVLPDPLFGSNRFELKPGSQAGILNQQSQQKGSVECVALKIDRPRKDLA